MLVNNSTFTNQRLNAKFFVFVSFDVQISFETWKFLLWEISNSIEPNVSPLGAGGDFETQINHGNPKPDRTTQRIVTVKPRLRQTAVRLSNSTLLT